MKPNPNHIPLIHNYCDRWCERCAFTQKCAIYENPGDIPAEELDMNNKAFWQKLSNTFAVSTKLLYEKAAEYGIDLDAAIEADKTDYKKQMEDELIKVEAHPLSKLTRKYTKDARKLFDVIKTENTSIQDIEKEINLGIKDESHAMSEADEYIDCMDVINWYLFQIQVKFMRAVSGTLRNSIVFDDDDLDDDGKPYIKDSDGSAKVALIGADRTMMAWRNLMDRLPEKESDIINVLALLQKIIRLGEETFPNARATIRPGLDE